MNSKNTLLTAMVILALLAVPTGTVSAQECSIDFDNQSKIVSVYNGNVDRIPSFLRAPVSGERVDLRIDTASGERQYSVTTDGFGRIDSFQEGTASNPTVRVETSESTLCSITTSNDPVAAARDAYVRDDIKISSNNVVKNVLATSAELVKTAYRLIIGY